jgi:small subunit ribosomal protein S2
MKLPTVEEMLSAGMHFGHRTSKWHPKIKPYVFGSRKGVHIIDLVKTKEHLALALNYVSDLYAGGKVVLFVGTKPQVKGLMKKTCHELRVPYVAEHWLGGMMTNFAIIKKSIRKYKDLVEKREAGKLTKYTKKEQLQFSRQIAKLDLAVGGLVDLSKLPDAIFIWDVKVEKTALAEAKKKNIPIIAVCDSNVNPEGIDYVIPSNDDASKAIALVMNLFKDAVTEGRERAVKAEVKTQKTDPINKAK